MADPALNGGEGDILLDYEDEQEEEVGKQVQSKEAAAGGDVVKKGFLGIHSTGFKDFLLKSELLKAIVDCGFEHPSEGTPRSQTCSSSRRSSKPALDASWRLVKSPRVGMESSEGLFWAAQYSTSAFPKLSWVWTYYARRSREWARRPSSFCRSCSNSSRGTRLSALWYCATRANSRSR